MFPRYLYKQQYPFVGHYLKCQGVSRSDMQVESVISLFIFEPWTTPTRNQGLKLECLLQQRQAAPPSAESVAPASKSGESTDVNLGDGNDWKAMDHLSKLKYLTPQVIQKGR